MANCAGCAYAYPVAGTPRVTCAFDWMKQQTPMPLGDQEAVNGGQYNFPLNFDPGAMTDCCPERSELLDAAKAMSTLDMRVLAKLLFGW